MDTEAIDQSMLIKALVILTAIPIVGIALWGEYFWKYIKEQKQESSEFDPNEEIQKIRFATLSALFLQLFLFLGTSQTRQAYPLTTTVLFSTAVFIHLWQQGSMEQRLSSISKTGKNPPGLLLLGLKTFFWMTLSGVLYLSTVFFSMSLFVFIAKLSQIGAPWNILMVLSGLIFGIISGLAMSFALGPVQIRKMFPTSVLLDKNIRNEIESCFLERSLIPPDLWVIDLEEGHSHNVMISGFRSGRGLFKPSLFISKPLLGSLTPGQLRSIVLHEIAHIQLNHLNTRFSLSSGLIIASSLFSGSLALLSYFAFHITGLSSWVAIISLVVCFMTALRIIENQGRMQEIEADIFAVKIGARLEDLEGALRKLDELNHVHSNDGEQQINPTRGTHPQTDERIKLLHSYFKKYDQKSNKSSETQDAA